MLCTEQKSSNTQKYKHQVWNNAFYKINQNMSKLIRIEPWWTKQNEMINHISVKHVTDTQRMPKPNLMIMSCWNHNTYLFISQAFISSLIIVMVEFRYQNHSICFTTDRHIPIRKVWRSIKVMLTGCWSTTGRGKYHYRIFYHQFTTERLYHWSKGCVYCLH